MLAVVTFLGACSDDDDDATPSTTTEKVTTTTEDRPSTTATSSTSASTSSTTTVAVSATPPTTAPITSAPAAADIPGAVRGTWRQTDGDTVGADDCVQDADHPDNIGQVLIIGATRFSFFESGGTLVEIHARDATRIDATYDTTYAVEQTRDRFVFDARDGGQTLVVEAVDSELSPGPVRYRRCP